MNKIKVIITDCHGCTHWLPNDSYGGGVYCDEIQKVVIEKGDNCPIPDWCPIKENRNDN